MGNIKRLPFVFWEFDSDNANGTFITITERYFYGDTMYVTCKLRYLSKQF